ncbi:Uncharacterised protein [Mesomycoplasma dispar]|uniref:Extracellular matrix-binding protein ebh GA module domain-containing protein n=1 Tax=Mesomycoplasma dispar TaxID=86660 RepID=A0AAJ5NQF3_9BACT|nr:hypothetical protein [Mesomycoplasma dispar]VEU61245.1 Uncharacterised protein [Mesomycoplasma dispar]
MKGKIQLENLFAQFPTFPEKIRSAFRKNLNLTVQQFSTEVYFAKVANFVQNYDSTFILSSKFDVNIKKDNFNEFLAKNSKKYEDLKTKFTNLNLGILKSTNLNQDLDKFSSEIFEILQEFQKIVQNYKFELLKFSQFNKIIKYANLDNLGSKKSEILKIFNSLYAKDANTSDFASELVSLESLIKEIKSIKTEYSKVKTQNFTNLVSEFDSKLKSNNLVNDFSNSIKEFEKIKSGLDKIITPESKKNTKLINLKKKTSEEVKKFSNLSNGIIQELGNLVNNSLTEFQVNQIKGISTNLNELSDYFAKLKVKKITLNSNPNYLNSENKQILDDFMDLSSVLNLENKLVNDNLVAKNKYFFLSSMLTRKDNIESELRRLNGNQRLKVAKNRLNYQLKTDKFSQNFLININKLADSKTLVSGIQEIGSEILKLADSLDTYKLELKNFEFLKQNSLTTQENKNLLDANNNLIKQKLDNYHKLDKIDYKNLAVSSSEFAQQVSLFSNLISKVKSENDVLAEKITPKKLDPNLVQFKSEAEQQLKVSLDNERLDRYSIKKYLSSASFTLENAKLWLKETENSDIDFTLTDLKLDEKDKNNLILEYRAKSKKDPSKTVFLTKNLLVKNNNIDINSLVSSLKIDSLDDYFEINYIAFREFEKNFFEKNNLLDFISKNLVQIKSVLKNYFTVELANKNRLEFSNDNKLFLDLNIKFNNQIIKKIKVKSKNQLNFKQIDTFPVKIRYTEAFKNSSLFKETYWTDPNYADYDFSRSKNELDYFWQVEEPVGGGGVGNYWFYKFLLKPALEELQKSGQIDQNKKFKTLDRHPKVVRVSYLGQEKPKKSDELSKSDLDKIFEKILKNKEFFDYQVPEGTTVELANFKINREVRRVATSAARQTITLKLLFKKGQLSREISIDFGPEKFIQGIQTEKDKTDLDLILEILNDKSGKKLLKNTQIKDIKHTHGEVSLVGKTNEEIIAKLNSLYSFAKIGKYEIFAKELISKDNLKGQAQIFFWYKKDGIEAPIITDGFKRVPLFKRDKAIRFSHWLPARYQDIKPKNGIKFSDEDFLPISNTEILPRNGESTIKTNVISDEDKQIINQINSRHFEYRKVNAEWYRKNRKHIKYRLVDPADIVEQNAELFLNYVLNLQNKVEINKENENLFDEKQVKPEIDEEDKKIDDTDEILPKIIEKQIFLDSDPKISIDTDKIVKNYFIYYYDVKTTNIPGEMTFKLGFINKQNTNIRYSSKKTIKLQNLENDYKTKLYPEVILNRIKFSDLIRKNQNQISKDALNDSTFSNFFDIKEAALNYNHFKIKKDSIKFLEIKTLGDKDFFRLKYKDGKTEFKGSTWYFLGNSESKSFENQLDLDTKDPLITVFESENSVIRSREIEPYYKDLYWNYDPETRKASWILKEKYIKETFLKNNAQNRKLKIQLFGNALVQNSERLIRIKGEWDKRHKREIKGGFDFDFDFEKLVKGELITINSTTKDVFFEKTKKKLDDIAFVLTAKYIKNQGIEFQFWLKDPKYGLVVDDATNHVGKGAKFYSSPEFDSFDPKKAFLLHKAGARIHIQYTNNVENENFGIKTNQFDYKNIDFTREEQPITFFSEQKAYNLDNYNPNQNVSYKLHNGYLQDFEFLHKGWNPESFTLAKNLWARTFGFTRGTATMLAKVNKDPNDGRFYIITNNHVEGGGKFDLSTLLGEDLTKFLSASRYIAIAGKLYSNSIDGGYGYWQGQYSVKNVPTWLVWTGTKQPDLNGQGQQFVDVTVLIVDINPLIKAAKEAGEFLKAAWLQNWFQLPNLKLNTNGASDLTFFGPNLKHFGVNGFPYGKQSGYIVNRTNSKPANILLWRQNGYTPIFFNSGNSGTGVQGFENEYISTLNAGSPFWYLQSWTYSSQNHNYFGINWKNENPLDLKNKFSLAGMIMRLNAKSPLEYDLPWFFKEFKN